VEDHLRAAALAVSGAEGERIYEDLLTAVASILNVEFALISVYVEPERKALRTLATIFEGRLARNVEYPLAGTPCERALGTRLRHLRVGRARDFSRVTAFCGSRRSRATRRPR
jgi:hypothetical protein